MAAHIKVEEAMDYIYSDFGLPEIDAEEFTIKQYAERYGVPISTADHHLTRGVRHGILSKRRVVCNGRRCWGYRLVYPDQS